MRIPDATRIAQDVEHVEVIRKQKFVKTQTPRYVVPSVRDPSTRKALQAASTCAHRSLAIRHIFRAGQQVAINEIYI